MMNLEKMGTRLLIFSFLLCLPAVAHEGIPPAVVIPTFISLDRLEVQDGAGIYTATRGTRVMTAPFSLPMSKVDPDRGHDVNQVGETDDGVVVLLDRYASRARPDERCVKGWETFVRVFSLPEKRELLMKSVESCLDGIRSANPPVTWTGNGFRIEGAKPQSFKIEGVSTIRETQ